MQRLRMICLIPLYGPIIYFFIINNELTKRGLISGKVTFAYLLIMSILGVIAMIFSKLLCFIFEIDFGYDILSFVIIAVLMWIFLLFPVIQFSKKLD
jgi:hypothetical protein